MTGRRNGVDPAGVEGMAAQDTAGAKQAATQGTVTLDGFADVAGAGGVKTAALAQMWANDELIALY
jgi:hypothetical protein